MDYSKGKNFDTFIKMSANIKEDYTRYLLLSLVKDHQSFKEFSQLKDCSENQGVRSETFQKKFNEFYSNFSKSAKDNMTDDDKEIFNDVLSSTTTEKKSVKAVNKRTHREPGKCDAQIESRYEGDDGMMHFHYCSKAASKNNAGIDTGDYSFCTLHLNKFKDEATRDKLFKKPVAKSDKTPKKNSKSSVSSVELDNVNPTFEIKNHEGLNAKILDVNLGNSKNYKFIVELIDESDTEIIAMISTNNHFETVIPVSESVKNEFLSHFKTGFSFRDPKNSRSLIESFNEKLEVKPGKRPSASSPKEGKTTKFNKKQISDDENEKSSDEGDYSDSEEIKNNTKDKKNEYMDARNKTNKSFEEKNSTNSSKSVSKSRIAMSFSKTNKV